MSVDEVADEYGIEAEDVRAALRYAPRWSKASKSARCRRWRSSSSTRTVE